MREAIAPAYQDHRGLLSLIGSPRAPDAPIGLVEHQRTDFLERRAQVLRRHVELLGPVDDRLRLRRRRRLRRRLWLLVGHGGGDTPIASSAPVTGFERQIGIARMLACLPEPFEIVALAASAGGLSALTRVLSALPGDFPAALLIVQHVDPRHRSLMAEILARRTRLEVTEAQDGERLQPGHAYVAPPDYHLLVDPDGTLALTQTKLVHFVRPSADLLFESVAATYGERSIAVVLSGSGEDGALGVAAVKKMGGTVIVQAPASAEFRGMPDAAAKNADFLLPLDEIAPALQKLCPPRTGGP